MIIWYIFLRFGMLYQETSGNPAFEPEMMWNVTWRLRSENQRTQNDLEPKKMFEELSGVICEPG
jgi:hypothetical protein